MRNRNIVLGLMKLQFDREHSSYLDWSVGWNYLNYVLKLKNL